MSCIFFRAVSDPKQKVTAGVLGYCIGYSEEKLRVPSLEEYRKYCTAGRQEGCCVYDFRARDETAAQVIRKTLRSNTRTI